MIGRLRRGVNSGSIFQQFTGINLRRTKNLPRTVRWLYDELEMETNQLNRNNKIWSKYLQCVESNQAAFLPQSIHQFVLQRCTNKPPKKFDRSVIERYLHNQDRLRFTIDQMRINNFKPTLEDYKFILDRFALMGSRSGCRRIMREVLDNGLQLDLECYNTTLMAYVRWIHRQKRNNHQDTRPQRIISAEISGLLEEMAKNSIQPNEDTYNYVLSILKDIQDFDGLIQLLESTYGIDISNPDQQPIQFLDFHAQNPEIIPPKVSPSVLRSIIDAVGNHSNLSTLISVFEALVNPITKDGIQTYVWKVTPEEASTSQVSIKGKNLSVSVLDRLLYHITQKGPSFLVKHYLQYAMWAYNEEKANNMAYRNSILDNASLDSLKHAHMRIPRIFFSAQLLTSIRIGVLDHHGIKIGVIRYLIDKLPMIIQSQEEEYQELANWTKEYESKVNELLTNEEATKMDNETFDNLLSKFETDIKLLNERASTLKLHNRFLRVAGNTWMPKVWEQVASRRRQSREKVRLQAEKEEREEKAKTLQDDYFVAASAPVS
ncbi:hypothetical protein E3Q23_01237 [Wallemia mellicola]|nr:hypothetical protein E3Q23_01237 [Wallemia mellicola]TIC18963.1 hypothetical protein E3Q13_01548 [Wallemia mellicola]TIC29356.1 hypothetical protein E3Q11_01420 [Wallemia mellicola]